MNILLVNDDGFFSPRFKATKDAISKYGTVYIFSPLTCQSGMGCALTTWKPLKVHKINEYEYHVEGTPVDCVQMAKTILGEDNIDLIISGCNEGFNLSNDILYSGTCGAAIQGLIFKKKAIAFSGPKEFDSNKIAKLVAKTLEYVFSNNLLSNSYWLNVNLQEKEYLDPKGILLTKQYVRETYYKILSYDDSDDTYHVERVHSYLDDISYDVGAVHHGYISITPVGVKLFDENIYNEVNKK